MQRTEPLEVGEIYHVMNKSIAGYKIFHSQEDYTRAQQILRYFAFRGSLPKFSQFLHRKDVKQKGFEICLEEMVDKEDRNVQIIAYCLMPTHLHIIVKQLKPNGISGWMGNTLNAYTRYFNTKHKRRGPLWVGKFKNVLVSTDEQLLHLTRYVHLNPVTANLVSRAEKWQFSSYEEYIHPMEIKYPMCQYEKLIDFETEAYQSFVDDQAGYQRELATIKKLILD